MPSPFAHVLGVPVEETAVQLAPVGFALLVALRLSLRRVIARRSRGSGRAD
jgi:hypothetical protein